MRLGERLVQAGKLKQADVNRVLKLQEDSGELLGKLLVRLGLVAERVLAESLAEHLGITLLSSSDYPDQPLLEDHLSPAFLKAQHVIPVEDDGETLTVAMLVPQDEFLQQGLAMAADRKIKPVLGLLSDLEAAYEKLYGQSRSAMGQLVEDLSGDEEGDAEDIEQLKDMASEAPVVRIVNLIFSRAIESRASDIHIEPFEDSLKVRYRIDGVMHEVQPPPANLAAAIISRIKIISRLNIAERRLPQDGRIQLRIHGKEIDLRVSTVPTLYGESVVMRILDRESIRLELEQMGFRPDLLEAFKKVLALPHGIILVTGPTGSGKTTTLYSALNRLNTPERKILTVEDPVEYQLTGINQIQANSKIGLDFARALRAIVRQDPDVIMIGEMRDLETARIAIQSALTGHLVLSTLHTNDAPSGVTRMLDMGVEDYLLSSTVSGIMAQRLVRTLCPHCRERYDPLPEEIAELGLWDLTESPDITLWKAQGCEHCGDTGYTGRTAIHELLVLNEDIRRRIMQEADAAELAAVAREHGMRTMYEDGLIKALAGETTVDEVLRVTQESENADV